MTGRSERNLTGTPKQPRELRPIDGFKVVIGPYGQDYLATHTSLFDDFEQLQGKDRPIFHSRGDEGVLWFINGTAIKLLSYSSNGHAINALATLSAMEEYLQRQRPGGLPVYIPTPVAAVIPENSRSQESEWYLSEQVRGITFKSTALRQATAPRKVPLPPTRESGVFHMQSGQTIPIDIATNAANLLPEVEELVRKAHRESQERGRALTKELGGDVTFYPELEPPFRGYDILVRFEHHEDNSWTYSYYITDPIITAAAEKRGN